MNAKVNNDKALWSQQAAIVTSIALFSSTVIGWLGWYIGRYQQQQNQKERRSQQIPQSVLKSPWNKELMLAVKLATHGEQRDSLVLFVYLMVLLVISFG
jgi:membrane protein YqaA with SNARE-associated domain